MNPIFDITIEMFDAIIKKSLEKTHIASFWFFSLKNVHIFKKLKY